MNQTRELNSFKDKVVLITGAGRGLGREIASAFAARGACVAANDLTPINLDTTVETIAAAGGRIRPYIFDIAKKMPAQAMIEQVRADWGRIDILVNNAGVQPRAALLDMDEWDWRRTLDVNLSGAFFMMQSTGRVMRAQGGGIMINIAAAAGRLQNQTGLGAFTASKAGLAGLTRIAAQELAPHNIRVIAICPGEIAAGMDAAFPPDEAPTPPEAAPGIPLGGRGRLPEIAELVLFLCSPAAAVLSGQVINLDVN